MYVRTHTLMRAVPVALQLALSSLRYKQLGKWQKRVAWHAVRRLAATLCEVLPRQPATPPPMDVRGRVTVQLAKGQQVVPLDDAC